MRSHFPCKSSSAGRRRRGPLRMLADSQTGFTIIEVVVASIMLTLLAGATATALIATGSFSGDQRSRSRADQLAQQDQERMRGMSISTLSGYSATRDVDESGKTWVSGTSTGVRYTITSSGKFISNAGGESCDSTGTGAAAYVLTKTQVDWVGNRRPPVTQESLITPKAGGTLLANVVDQSNNPVQGVTVQVAGKESETATTTDKGCVVFGGLTQSGYYVIFTKSNYVDTNGNATHVDGASVSASGTAFPSVNPTKMGLAGSISASFSAKSGTLAGQAAPSLSVSHAERANPLITTVASPATTIATTQTLFPFTSSYTAWAGKCPGNMPPSANLTGMLVNPGATTSSPVVAEPALNVRVYYPTFDSAQPTLNRIKPDHVKLYYTQTAGGTCSESWQAGVASNAVTSGNGSLSSPGQPFAGTTTNGSTTYTGSYTICADYDPAGAGTTDQRWGQLTGQTNTNFSGAALKNVVIPSSGTVNTGSGVCA